MEPEKRIKSVICSNSGVDSMKKFELLGATAIALLAATPTLAQTASTDTPQASEEDTAEGGEIIVTASKREQTLQDVPISVSVTSSQTVERAQIRDLIDLQSVVPSLKVPQFQSSTQTNFVIRGFGNGANNAGIESSVGVFIDGVYRSRSASAIADLPEIERIEVLRGPQSTLFGKNVSAGAISIITKKPKFDFGLKAEATAGNYGQIAGKLSVTGPLSETIAARLSGSFDTSEGYFRNVNIGGKVNNRNRYSLRGDVLFEPSDALSFRLIADYNRINEVCCGAVPIQNGAATAFIGRSRTATAAEGGPGLGAAIGNPARVFNYELAYNENPNNKLTGKGLSLQGDYDLGGAKLTTITSYREQKVRSNLDVDFTGARIVNQLNGLGIKSFTSEVRLASKGDGRVNWLVGGFLSKEKITTSEDIRWGPDGRPFVNFLTSNLSSLIEGLQAAISPPGTIIPGQTYIAAGTGVRADDRLKDTSYSLFGQADFELVDGLTISGGLAYLNDKKRVRTVSLSNDIFARLNLQNLSFGPIPIANLPAALQGLATILRPDGTLNIVNGVPTPLRGLASPIPVNLFSNSQINLAPLQFLSQPFDIPNATENGVFKGDKVTYMGRIAYDFSKRLNAYATYSKGWKASAVNLSRDSRPPDVNGVGRSASPEDVTVYEVGVKGSFPGGFVNLAVFKQSIKGFQSNAFTGTGFNLVNAGKQSVKGFELDGSYRPVKALTLGFGVTYLDPKYDSFTRAACVLVTIDPRCTPGVQFRDLSGRRPPGISKWSVNLNGNYDVALGGGWKGFIRGDYSYASNVNVGAQAPPAIATFNFNTVNAAIGVGNEDKLEVQFFVRNLIKDKALQTVFASVAQSGSFAGYPIPPRTYGVTLRKTF
jgi:iron complex outermembrane recepter protein